MEIINYPLLTSSPVSSADTPVPTSNVDGLPSPNLTEPSYSSPKNEGANGASSSVSNTANTSKALGSNPTVSTLPSSAAASGKPVDSTLLSAMLRSLTAATSPNLNFSVGKSASASKELNITEYSNKELKAMKKRCRTVMTPSQSRVLRKVLEQTAFPSTEIRENLAKLLGMKPRTVQIWFQNQRQKSRQGRSGSTSSSEDLVGSPNSNVSSGSEDESCGGSPFESSPVSMTSNPSPGFTALTAAAFALSNSPIEQSTPAMEQPQQAQRYSTFHGAVYKSTPGCLPTILPTSNHYRGNTAAAMNAKRMAAAVQAGMHNFVVNLSPPPPNQPQNIPTYPQQQQAQAQAHQAIPLDILASAVSKFRPNGYNYYMKPPTPVQQQQQQQVFYSLHAVNRNRLAPLRAASPPSDTPETKLPSLKDLAQVASLGMTELDHQIQGQQQRSKSFSIEAVENESVKLPATRRYSSAEVVSNNAAAPNSSSSTRRPW